MLEKDILDPIGSRQTKILEMDESNRFKLLVPKIEGLYNLENNRKIDFVQKMAKKYELQEIISRIRDTLKNLPFNIISAAIYGSWAKGMQREDSDLDILVVSNQIHPKKHKRGKEIAQIKEKIPLSIPLDILLLTSDECISNFRNHNPLFLDIAVEGIILLDNDDFLKNLMEETREYIEYRGIEKLSDGWRFPVLYREATDLSKVSNKDFAIVMLTDGERDFEIGVKLIKENYFDKAVYHFQQAVEKSIKAVLIAFGEFKKTHFVDKILLDKLESIDLQQDWKEKIAKIAKIATEIEPEVTWSRYPGIDQGSLW
ncbi:MAG: HEPN domain-containing protein, partial [Leptonema sp. (in: bacteria)]